MHKPDTFLSPIKDDFCKNYEMSIKEKEKNYTQSNHYTLDITIH